MTKTIKRVAIIGTGVIGASWAALFLAKGLEVVATDISPNAKEALDHFIAAAWPALERLGLAPHASLSNLRFTDNLEAAVADSVVRRRRHRHQWLSLRSPLHRLKSPARENSLRH